MIDGMKLFVSPDPSLNPIKDGEAYVVNGNVHVNPRTFAELQRGTASDAGLRSLLD